MIDLIAKFWQFFLRQDVRGVIGRTLLFLLLLGFIFARGDQIILKSAAAIFSALILDLYFLRRELGRLIFPYSSLVTGCLIALILAPQASLWQFVFASTLAVGSKEVIKIGQKHIFNPAGFGLLVTSQVFGSTIAWWGVAFNDWAWLILLLGAGAVLFRTRRLFLPLGFLTLYWLYLVFIAAPLDQSTFLDGTLFLFAMVMLPEIKTSPASGYWKYTFGLLVGLIFLSATIIKIPVTDTLISSLLLSNLASYFLRRVGKSNPG